MKLKTWNKAKSQEQGEALVFSVFFFRVNQMKMWTAGKTGVSLNCTSDLSETEICSISTLVCRLISKIYSTIPLIYLR